MVEGFLVRRELIVVNGSWRSFERTSFRLESALPSARLGGLRRVMGMYAARQRAFDPPMKAMEKE